MGPESEESLRERAQLRFEPMLTSLGTSASLNMECAHNCQAYRVVGTTRFNVYNLADYS